MDLHHQLLYNVLENHIEKYIGSMEYDIAEVLQSHSILALNEIQSVIINEELDDFNAIEQIVIIFEKYGINSGVRHDF